MSRYINLDEAKARTTQLVHGYEVEQWLDTIPSVDIDRPQGEWIWGNEKKSWHKCSVCGEQAYSYYDELSDNVEELFDYCPHCGARMKGADDE